MVALVVAAGATLTPPMAFRSLIDQGFSVANAGHIDRYFLTLLLVSTVLAVATAARFYTVSWLGERVTADIRSAVYANVILLVFGAIVLVLRLGAQDVLAGRMSGGQLGAFVLYAVLVADSLGALAEVWGDLQRAAGATERLLELFHARSDITSPLVPQALARCAGAVSFESVNFAYPSRPDIHALRDFTLGIGAGETVALVGPSGDGKCTVFALLLRYYDPQHGCVRIDGHDIRAMALDSFRSHIGVVSQDAIIFSSDAAANIRYGKADAVDTEIHQAASRAYADEFIARLPDGYATEPLAKHRLHA